MTTLKPLQGDKKAKAVNEEGLAMKAIIIIATIPKGDHRFDKNSGSR